MVSTGLDWRLEEDYSYSRELYLAGWAWEFLRRNPEYIATYDAWERNKTPESTTKAGQAWGLLIPTDPMRGVGRPVPGKMEVESYINWKDALSVKFAYHFNEPEGSSEYWPGYPDQIAIVFRFDRALEPQIEVAARYLRECRDLLKSQGIHDPEGPLSPPPKYQQFELYLRLLDAKSVGASYREMALILFGDKKKWRQAKSALASAIKMSTSGYRDILKLPNPTATKP